MTPTQTIRRNITRTRPVGAGRPRVPAGARVLVIGAGFAGIAAARALRAAGYEVRILEARDRAGGRAWTVDTLGVPTDLGPSWLHGGDENVLKPLARELDIAWHRADYTAGLRIDRVHGAPPSSLAAFLARLEPEAGIAAALRWPAMRWWLGGLLADRSSGHDFAAVVTSAFAPAADPVARADLDALRGILETIYAAPLDEVAIEALLASDGHMLPDSEWFLTGGVGTLAMRLAEGLPIETGRAVRRLEWSPGRVTAVTDAGDVQADAAVLTPSLGVLARNGLGLVPALPEAYGAALGRFRMGLLNKVFVRLPRPVLDPDVELLAVAGDAYFANVVNLGAYEGAPVYLGLTHGAGGRAVERTDDATLAEALRATLSAATGGEVPEPEGVCVSRWAQDPLAFGSYSLHAVGATGRESRVLAQPIADTLFLAGEAIHEGGTGAAHQAWASGLTAAARIAGRD